MIVDFTVTSEPIKITCFMLHKVSSADMDLAISLYVGQALNNNSLQQARKCLGVNVLTRESFLMKGE